MIIRRWRNGDAFAVAAGLDEADAMGAESESGVSRRTRNFDRSGFSRGMCSNGPELGRLTGRMRLLPEICVFRDLGISGRQSND